MSNFKSQVYDKITGIKHVLRFVIKISICIFVLFFITQNEQAQSKKYDFSAVDKIIDNAITAQAFPSAVLLVGNSKEILYQNAYGRLTYDDDAKPTTLKTIYDLASVTKVIAT